MSSRYSSSSRGEFSCKGSIASSNSLGLPDDEFRKFQRLQNRERLENYFLHRGSSINDHRAQTSYQKIGLSQNDRCRISKVKHATRAALSSNFGYAVSSCDGSNQSDTVSDTVSTLRTVEHNEHVSKYERPIPQKYLDEYRKLLYDDDEKLDVSQYNPDCSFKVPWHLNERLGFNTVAMDQLTLHCEKSPYLTHSKPVISIMFNQINYVQAPLASKFSFDSEVTGKRNFFSRWR